MGLAAGWESVVGRRVGAGAGSEEGATVVGAGTGGSVAAVGAVNSKVSAEAKVPPEWRGTPSS